MVNLLNDIELGDAKVMNKLGKLSGLGYIAEFICNWKIFVGLDLKMRMVIINE